MKKWDISTDKCTKVLGNLCGLQKTSVGHLPHDKHPMLYGHFYATRL